MHRVVGRGKKDKEKKKKSTCHIAIVFQKGLALAALAMAPSRPRVCIPILGTTPLTSVRGAICPPFLCYTGRVKDTPSPGSFSS